MEKPPPNAPLQRAQPLHGLLALRTKRCSRRLLPAAALAKRREGGLVVEVEHLLFDARDARGGRVLGFQLNFF